MRGNSKGRRVRRIIPIAVMIMIAVLTSFMIISCGSNDTAGTDTAASEEASAVQNEAKAEKKKESSKESDTEKPQEKAETEGTTAKAVSKKSTSSAVNTKSTTKSNKSSAKETTKSTQAAKVCYISIEGYCSSKKITMKSGDTVYDILKRSGASVSARNSGYGVYVEGINGRYEFDEGPSSGWVYYVNGSEPNTSCGNYKVSSGDNIVWDYVK